jgi:hypothetical protein
MTAPEPSFKPLFNKLLLGAGAMKAGTTWLYRCLSHHPEIYFCQEKETHYLAHVHGVQRPLELSKRLAQFKRFSAALNPDHYNSRWTRRRLRWFTAWLDEPLTDEWYRHLFYQLKDNQYAADFSNLTSLIPSQGWPHVRALAEDIKVIYVVRDPMDRLWSHVKFHAQFVGELEQFLESSPQQVIEMARTSHIWINGEYGQTIETLAHSLTPEQLLLIDFNHIQTSPLELLRRVEAFLAIQRHDYDPALVGNPVNSSHPLRIPSYFKDAFSADCERIKEEMGQVLRQHSLTI